MTSAPPTDSSAASSENKRPVAWITGGSNGFGLVLAETFLQQNYDVVLIGRTGQRLEAARETLSKRFGQPRIQTIRADVSCQEEVEKSFFLQYEKDQRLDVLVNCVGQSCRGAVDSSSPQLYRQMMEQNFFTTVNGTTTCLPWLIKSGGSIVNIASLAAKTSWPLVSPYSAAKAAVANYSGSLRIELKGRVHVLLVCPGPIASEHQKDRYSNQTRGLDSAANRPGAGAPVKSLDPKKLSEKILQGIQSKTNELILPGKSRLLFIASAISSRLGDWVMKKAGKK